MSLTSSQFRSGSFLPSSSTTTTPSMKTLDLPTTWCWLWRLRGMPANGRSVARFRARGLVVLGLGDGHRQDEFCGSRFGPGSCSLFTKRRKDAAFQTIRSDGRFVNGTVQAIGNWSWPGSTKTLTGERTIRRERSEKDEGDWRYSPEWWGTQGGGWGRSRGETVFETASTMGNGVVSVTAHPASRPSEREIKSSRRKEQKEFEVGDCPEGLDDDSSSKLLGYEWRVLRFNDVTRQSVAKVKAISTRSGDIVLLQQPDCIAFECVKSMISAGMTAVSLCGLDFKRVQQGLHKMRVLCVGMGGGSVPLFLANRLPGATVDVVDIDSAVIAAAVDSMGFPPTRPPAPSNGNGAATATEVEALLWGNILERITVYENDGESFLHEQLKKAAMEIEPRKYDLVVVDAFDGKDVVPWSLCNRNGSFLRDLSSLLSDEHGAVVVNLHTDSAPPSLFERISGKFGPGFDVTLPQGRRVQDAALAYRDLLLQKPSGSWPRTFDEHDPSREGNGHFRGDPLKEGNGLAFTGKPPKAGNGVAFTGDTSLKGNGLAFTGDTPLKGNGLAFTGDTPLKGNGLAFTGNTPLKGNGLAFTGDTPLKGNGLAFTSDPPTDGHGLAFTLSVAYQANITLVVCRGARLRGEDSHGLSELATEVSITEKLMAEAEKVQDTLRIPFQMSKRVSRGFHIVR